MLNKYRAWCVNTKEMKRVAKIDITPHVITCEIEVDSECRYGPLLITGKYPDAVLMQSTGLKDKNGVEIFEGDILRYGNDAISVTGEVITKLGEAILYGNNLCWNLYELNRDGGVKNTLIIGNIYEKPELRSNKMIAKKCNACSSVYLSGPITGLKEKDARAAFEKAEKLIEAEYERVVNPMRFESAYQSANLTYDEIMDIDIRLLKMCKTIYMLKNWEGSKGACLERLTALQLGMKIIYED